MKSAIVILNYNSADVTLNYLRSIKDYGAFQHIVVVDNASSQPSTAELETYCRENGMDFLALRENKGYAAGNNAGAQFAAHTYGDDVIFISNPDIICPEESAKKILSVFEEDSRIGIVTGLVHVFDKERKPHVFSSFAYRVPGRKDMYLNCFPVTTKIRKDLLHTAMYFEASDVQKNGRIEVGVVSGCFFAIRTAAYLEIEGFDEDTFLYYEEPILGYRLREKQYKTVVIDTPVYHDEDPYKKRTLKKQWRTYKITTQSALVYLRKYLGVGGFGCIVYRCLSFIGFLENALIPKIKG